LEYFLIQKLLSERAFRSIGCSFSARPHASLDSQIESRASCGSGRV